MALKYPDILEHNNPNFALVDTTEIRGGAYPLSSLADLGTIPNDKRKIGSIVFASGTSQYYYFIGDVDTEWTNTTKWTGGLFGGGTGTANYIPLWSNSDTLGDSVLSQSGNNIILNNGNLQIDTPATNTLGNGIRLNRPGNFYAGFEIATNDTVDWSIGANSDGFGIYENGTAATTRFIIKDGGNVGIGTTSPTYKLDVNGSGRISGEFIVEGDGTTTHIKSDKLRVSRAVNGAFGALTLGSVNNLTGDVGTYYFKSGTTTTLTIGSDGVLTTANNIVSNGNIRINTDADNAINIYAGGVNDWSYINYYGIDNVRNAFHGVNQSGHTVFNSQDNDIYLQPGSGITRVQGNMQVDNSLYLNAELFDSNGTAGLSGEVLSSTATGTSWVNLNEISGVDGSGTANYIPIWSDSDTIGNSIIYSTGTTVGINTTTPETTFDVNGAITIGGTIYTRADGNRNTLITSETDLWRFKVASEALELSLANGAIFNENGMSTMDFRVESDTNTHMLFVDAGTNKVGIGGTPSYELDVNGQIGINGSLTIHRPVNSSESIVIGGGGVSATGDNLAFFGDFAGNNNTTGFNNTAIGSRALQSNTTGYRNTAIGRSALQSNTVGYNNVTIGDFADYQATNASNNTVIGAFAFFNRISGPNNVAIGRQAARYIANGGGFTTGSYNVYIGSDVRASADGVQNEIAIGYNASGLGSNTIVIGNNDITKTILKGDIGIGTSTPSEKLHINNGNIHISDGFGLNFGNTGWRIGKNLVVATGEVLTGNTLQIMLWDANNEGLQVINNSNEAIFEVQSITGGEAYVRGNKVWHQGDDTIIANTISGTTGTFTDIVTIYDIDSTNNPRLSVGRRADESLNFSVVDTVATIYHKQDETNTAHVHRLDFQIWSNSNGNSEFNFGFADISGGSLTQVFNIQENGLVGINTGAGDPIYELDVRGMAADASIYLDDGGIGAPVRLRSWGGGNSTIYLGNEESSLSRQGSQLQLLGNNIPIRLSTDNGTTPALYVTTNDDVGINTTTPSRRFHVVEDSNDEVARFQATGSNDIWLELVHDNQSAGIPTFGANLNNYNWRFDSDTALSLTTNKYLGIGLGNPLSNLHVYESTTGYTEIRMQNNITSGDNDLEVSRLSTFIGDGSELFRMSVVNDPSIHDSGNLIIYNRNGSTNTLIERFRINAVTGYVGINNSSPNRALDVTGQIEASTDVIAGNLLYSGLGLVHVDDNTGLEFTANDTINLYTAGIDRLTILPSGNVGIAETNPLAGFHVNSSIVLLEVGVNEYFRLTYGSDYNYLQVGQNGLDTDANLRISRFSSNSNIANFDVRADLTSFTGDISITNNKLRLGASNDSYIQHNGSNLITFYQSNWGGDFKFRAANNTGVQNDILFIEGNNQRIGINTITPSYTIDSLSSLVSIARFGSDSDTAIYLDSGMDGLGTESSYIYFRDNTTAKWFIGKDTGNDFIIYDNTRGSVVFEVVDNGDMYLMQSGGNVGIGTTSPNTKLHLFNSSGGDTLTLQGSAGTSQAAIVFTDNNSGETVISRIVPNVTSLLAGDESAGISFQTIVDGTLAERLRIHTNGNVGIGTTSPSEKLEVNGNILASEAALKASNTASDSIGLSLESPSGGVNVGFNFEVGDTNLSGLTSKNLVIFGTSATSDIAFSPGTSSPGLLTLKGTGNVGIGTTSPSTKLDVNGIITATGGTSTQWNTAYGWGDWSTGVNKTFVDALNINADTLDGNHLADITLNIITDNGGTTTNDIEFTLDTIGVILKSPNGTRYRITVNDDGELVTTAL